MKIQSYENDNNISLEDKVTGSDAENSGKTKSYTFQRIKDFFIAQGFGDSSGKEDSSNKSTNIVTDGESDVKYTSAKAVKTYVDANSGSLPFKILTYAISFLSDGSVNDDVIYSNLTGNIVVNPSGTGLYEITSDTSVFTSNKTFIAPFGYQGTTTNSGAIRLPIFSSNILVGYYWIQRITSTIVRLNFTNLSGVFVNPYSILIDRTIQIEIKIYN